MEKRQATLVPLPRQETKTIKMVDENIDYDEHWAQALDTYANHPTSRHRRRFALQSLQKIGIPPEAFVFDYGCGAGLLLKDIQKRYQLTDIQLGGCDLSSEAIEIARKEFESPYFYHQQYPKLVRPIDIAITTEVIEHTDQYRDILSWLWKHLRLGGRLIVTTPGGTMDPPDVYYGHVQHFQLTELVPLLEEIGFAIRVARNWGFPLFTLQKWITRKSFEHVKAEYMHGPLNSRKRFIFTIAYYLYFVHDLLPWGPQIFILAEKTRGSEEVDR